MRKNISSGIEKRADELMSAIIFCTTPKGDLTHFYYIFSRPEPFRTDMNNGACSRLGTILHLDIQKGNKAMKTYNFQIFFAGAAA